MKTAIFLIIIIVAPFMGFLSGIVLGVLAATDDTEIDFKEKKGKEKKNENHSTL